MSGKGRPLRFLALVALSWVGARVALLWPPTESLPEAVKALAPAGIIAARQIPAMTLPRVVVPARPMISKAIAPAAMLRPEVSPEFLSAGRSPDPLRIQMALLALVHYGAAEAAVPPAAAARLSPTGRLDPLPDRWSAGAWAAFRPGLGIGAAPGGGQLGGSQMGLRLAYMLKPDARLTGVARFTSPIGVRGREVSLGFEWQPTRAPVRIVAEHRFALDGGGGGQGIGVIAGAEAALAQGFRLEAYGQAGVVRRQRAEPYADGAARATRGVVDAGAMRFAVGAGVWGGAQREAARLDLGPSATLTLPLADKTIRVAIDWRQRVAGNARPGSGPALTIGGDF